jgi:hypothetical protein
MPERYQALSNLQTISGEVGRSRSDFWFGHDAEDDAEKWLKNPMPKVMRIVARLAA